MFSHRGVNHEDASRAISAYTSLNLAPIPSMVLRTRAGPSPGPAIDERATSRPRWNSSRGACISSAGTPCPRSCTLIRTYRPESPPSVSISTQCPVPSRHTSPRCPADRPGTGAEPQNPLALPARLSHGRIPQRIRCRPPQGQPRQRQSSDSATAALAAFWLSQSGTLLAFGLGCSAIAQVAV